MMRSPIFMAKVLDQLRRGTGTGSLGSVGWPVLCGVGLMLAGALLVGLSYQLRIQASKLQQELQQTQRSGPKQMTNHTRGVPVIFPPSTDYTADLAQIFDIAKAQGIVLTNGDYRDADATALGLDTRLVDLRINENYSKLKEFLASVLNAMPHAAVQELRIERKDGAAVKQQIFLKFALVYSPRPVNAQMPQAATEKKPSDSSESGSAKVMP